MPWPTRPVDAISETEQTTIRIKLRGEYCAGAIELVVPSSKRTYPVFLYSPPVAD